MTDHQPDLFDWEPTPSSDAPSGARVVVPFPVQKRRRPDAGEHPGLPALISPFPQERRTAKVRDVATKLLAKTTSRAVEHYRAQVSGAMEGHLRSRRVPAEQHRELIRKFWVAVDCEVARRVNGRQRPGGAA